MENKKLKSSIAILVAVIVVIVGIVLIVNNKKNNEEVINPEGSPTSTESVISSIFKKKPKASVEPVAEEGTIEAEKAVWEEETPFYTTTKIPESTMNLRSGYAISLDNDDDNVYEIVGPSNYEEVVRYYDNPTDVPEVEGGVNLSKVGRITFGDNEYQIFEKMSGDALTYYYIKNENVGLLFSTETSGGLVGVDLASVTLK